MEDPDKSSDNTTTSLKSGKEELETTQVVAKGNVSNIKDVSGSIVPETNNIADCTEMETSKNSGMDPEHAIDKVDYKDILPEKLIDQVKGVIYGNCIGDAIGLLTEFMSKEQARMVRITTLCHRVTMLYNGTHIVSRGKTITLFIGLCVCWGVLLGAGQNCPAKSNHVLQHFR